MALRPLIPFLGGGRRGRQSLGKAWLTWCILGQPALHIETLSLKEKNYFLSGIYLSCRVLVYYTRGPRLTP